ncbi:hypothetical protein [Brevibacillus choshinensis]|uniref:COG1470 family protein n=1 Tax=Brevibacillus choshinensis TaxID=54911 RepID=UPI001EEE376A|nr:hypothetical protein [Brevibacillus choshinensis]
MSKKNEAGKFIVMIAVVIGIALGSIYLLQSLVFKPKSQAATPKVPEASHVQAEQTIALENIQKDQPISTPSNEEPASGDGTSSIEEISEPFYAKLKDGEYVGVWHQSGTEKQINLSLGTKEVKSLLGNPDRESYEDGESIYLCYQYGKLSIFFEEDNQRISFMTYEDDDSLLQKPWLLGLDKTQDTGNVDFYQSPSGYTSVKVDHVPEQKRVIVYLQSQYGASDSQEQTHAAQEPVTSAAGPEQKQSTPNASGGYTIHPGEELTIEDWTVTNKSPYHSAAYQIDVNYHFAYNNSNWVKVITNPEKKLELMPGETSTVQIKVKSSKHAPKGSYRYIVSLKQGWQTVGIKEFTVEVQ